jgi:hypothetical protein
VELDPLKSLHCPNLCKSSVVYGRCPECSQRLGSCVFWVSW